MRDNKLEKMREDYENIQIPETLRQRVELGISQGKKEKKRLKMITFAKKAGMGVAAALVAITVLVNSGATIAHAMGRIPVLGVIAEIVTFRQYERSDKDMEAKIKIPEVAVRNEDGSVNRESTEAVNKSIEEYTDEIIACYEADVEAAGGQGHETVDLDYTVITDNDRLFSLRFDQLLIMAGGNESVRIYHIDKKTGELIHLDGIFQKGVDFITPISENIKEQMRQQMEEDENITYWVDSDVPEWDFQSIKEDSTFYINEAGRLVLVFDEYEVAPGFMGSVEFEIPTEVIADLVQEGFM